MEKWHAPCQSYGIPKDHKIHKSSIPNLKKQKQKQKQSKEYNHTVTSVYHKICRHRKKPLNLQDLETDASLQSYVILNDHKIQKGLIHKINKIQYIWNHKNNSFTENQSTL